MEVSVNQALALSVLSYVVWRIVRPFVVKSSLSIVPGPPSTSWWKGNLHQLFDRRGWAFHEMLAQKYGSAVKVNALFGDEQLYTFDPLALHHVIVKDQYDYEETGAFISGNSLMFGPGLISTLGEHHRKQRKMLNPVFSPKHMRSLTPIFHPVAHELRDVFARHLREGHEEVDVLKWMSRAALEIIGRGGLGYSFNALDDRKKNKYNDAVKLLSPIAFNLTIFRQFLPQLTKIGSPAFRRKILMMIPSPMLQKAREIADIIYEQSLEVYTSKKEALAKGDEAIVEQYGKGNDIMSILLKANMEAKEEDRLPESEVLGQMNVLIFAGHDTTNLAVARILHTLSMHQEAQEMLRKEVTAARKEHGGDLDYDTLMGLPYLDSVCRETLRVYPPAPMVSRTTKKDMTLPLLFPIKSADGKSELKEIALKNNTNVIISILNANRSKEIWGEDAAEWKPERWLNKTPESVAKARLPGVYSSMMTFLGGGRACIGFKFSELEMKVVLSVLLESFVFHPSDKKIHWNMAGLVSPVVEGTADDITPTLPLRLEAVERK